jgi:methylase of polypeptide subunit release factors
MQIYQPAEDSYLLQEAVEKFLINLTEDIEVSSSSDSQLSRGKFSNINKIKQSRAREKRSLKPKDLKINNIKEIKILDMGSGSGIQALPCKKLGFKNILTADINIEAVKHLKKQKLKAVHSNLFTKIPKRRRILPCFFKWVFACFRNLIISSYPFLSAVVSVMLSCLVSGC